MTESNGNAKTSRFANVVREAIAAAGKVYLTHFDFNEVQVTVAADSDPTLIDRDYHRALAGKIPTNRIGPYPNNPLTTEQSIYDQKIDESKHGRYQWHHR